MKGTRDNVRGKGKSTRERERGTNNRGGEVIGSKADGLLRMGGYWQKIGSMETEIRRRKNAVKSASSWNLCV